MSDILGYDSDGNAIIQARGFVYTQAFIICAECTDVISSIGGPRLGSLCPMCMADGIKQQMKTIENVCSVWKRAQDGSYEQALSEKGYYNLLKRLTEMGVKL
jgi:hypothetical protein